MRLGARTDINYLPVVWLDYRVRAEDANGTLLAGKLSSVERHNLMQSYLARAKARKDKQFRQLEAEGLSRGNGAVTVGMGPRRSTSKLFRSYSSDI